MENTVAAQNDTNMELLDAIRELRDSEKKILQISRIRLATALLCLVVCVIVSIVVFGKFDAFMKKADTALDALTKAGNNINALSEKIEKINLEKIVKSLDNIVEVSGETIGEIHQAAGGLDQLIKDADNAMQHINSINYEELNNGIQRLNDILEPVANFFNIFKK